MDEGLRRELLDRIEIDQAARNALTPLFGTADRLDPNDPAVRRVTERMSAVDRDNTAWLRRIVEDRGWPTVQMVGSEGEEVVP